MNPTNTDPASDQDSSKPVTKPNLLKMESGWGTGAGTSGGGNIKFNPDGDKSSKGGADTGAKANSGDGIRVSGDGVGGKTGSTGTTGAASSLLPKELAGAAGVAGAATTLAGGAKNLFWGSRRRKQATVFGGTTATLVGGAVFGFIIISGPGQIVQLDQMLQRNFNTTNGASSSRSHSLIANLRAQDAGETRLGIRGQNRVRSITSDLGDIGITLNPNSAGYFGAKEAGSIDTGKLKAKFPELDGKSSDEQAKLLEEKLNVPADSLSYKGNGVFDINATGWSTSALRGFVTNFNDVLGNGPLTTALTNRSMLEYFDIPDIYHVYNSPGEKSARKITNAADAAAAERDAAQKEVQPVEDAPPATEAVDKVKSEDSTYNSVAGEALLYTGGACLLKSTASSIVTINRYRVVLPAAVMALRFISIGEQIKNGQDISQQDAEGAEQSLYDSKGQSVWQGLSLQVTDGTPHPTGTDIPAQYGQAFSTDTTANTITKVADDSVGGKAAADIACSPGGQFAQAFLSFFQYIGGAAATLIGQPEITAADYASLASRVGTFAGEAFIQMKAVAFLQNFILSKTATGTLAKDAFSGPVGGNLLAYGAREAANMGSIAEGGISLGSNVTNLVSERQQQQDEQQFRSQSLFARMFDINDSRSLFGHLAQSVRPNYAQNISVMASSFGNIGSTLLSNFSSIFIPKSQAASNLYDWGFPIYSIPQSLLDDPDMADPYANGNYVAGVLDAQCLKSDGTTDPNCALITKAKTCFGVTVAKDAGVWNITNTSTVNQDDVDPNSESYQSAGCADPNATNVPWSTWKRMIMFAFDTHTMAAMDCYLGDNQSCTDIGFGNSSVGSSSPAPTPAGGLTNPFPDGWTPNRLDMGYDGAFKKQIVSPCDGKVIYYVNSQGPHSWEGDYVVVQCSSTIPGLPSNAFYFAEGITATVKQGPVTAGQQIAVPGPTGFSEGPGGIEWGLADPNNPGNALAESGVNGMTACSAASKAMVLSFSQWVQKNMGLPPPSSTNDAGCA